VVHVAQAEVDAGRSRSGTAETGYSCQGISSWKTTSSPARRWTSVISRTIASVKLRLLSTTCGPKQHTAMSKSPGAPTWKDCSGVPARSRASRNAG
jgi:hypothetical protein